MTLGTYATPYTAAQLQTLLAAPAGNDISLALAHQLIVAELNIAAMAYADLQIPAPNAFTYVPPQYVTDAINAANAWIGNRQLPITPKVLGDPQVTPLIAALESYNTAASDKDCQFVPTVPAGWPGCADLGAAAGKNVVLLNGGFTGSSSDVGGSLFANGNVSLASYSVGGVLDQTTHPVTVVAGGTLTFTNGWITGDVWASNPLTGAPASVKSGMDVAGSFADLNHQTLIVTVTMDGAPTQYTLTFPASTTTLDAVTAAIGNYFTGVVASKSGNRLVLTTKKTGTQQGITINDGTANGTLNFSNNQSATGIDPILIGTPASVQSSSNLGTGTLSVGAKDLRVTVTTDGVVGTEKSCTFGADVTLSALVTTINTSCSNITGAGVVASATGDNRLVLTTTKKGSQQGISIGFWGTANSVLGFSGTESATGMDAAFIGGGASTSTANSPFDFSAASTTLNALSSYLLGYADANAIVATQYETLVLKNTSSSTFTVFNVPADVFSTVKAIDVETDAATVIVNVTTTLNTPPASSGAVTFPSSGTFNVNGKSLIWNFPDASTLTISQVGVVGTVLAPGADVTAGNCQIDGSVFAKSFAGANGVPTCQVNSAPFTACIPSSD